MAGTQKREPYGSWKSPITSDLIVSGSIGLGQIEVDGEDVYWSESRPQEGGRNVIVQRTPDGGTSDVRPAPFNARTRVHEYGGGSFMVADGVVYFSNFGDQRLYRMEQSGEPQPITPEVELRYADGIVDRRRKLIFCVREDHTEEGKEAVNTLVQVNIAGDNSGGQVVAEGADFYASPRLNADGSRLAWLQWYHPDMPWDGTELWVADVGEDGSLENAQRVAGGREESIFQPEWSPEGVLHFVSDRSNWWNLYRVREGEVELLCEMDAEFGMPQWVFGMSSYGFEAEERIVCRYGQHGFSYMAVLDTARHELEPIDTAYSSISGIRVSKGRVVFSGGSPTEHVAIVQLDLTSRKVEVLRRSSDIEVDPGYVSEAQAIEFPTENGQTAHAFFYPPNNRDYAAPEGERPPLLVISHGGPTSATVATLSLSTQFWTSRGFGVLDVNYGGSTGYGREYRQRLNGEWGIVDVNDCINGARYLVERGEADGERLAIRGGSAGGYTTLNALTFHDVFKAGASYYGISDLEAMARDTHKFESRYLDSMIGPYPERADLYRERSAIHSTHLLSAPMILFQGLEDKVVPPNQAEMMVDALRKKGLPVAYVAYEGEQHGFRKAENIKRSLDAELYFYSRIFGFELAEAVEPVEIENL